MPGTSAATVTGSALTGSTLTGHLSSTGLPDGYEASWTWKRDGAPVSTGATRVLDAADWRHRMSATAALTAPGYVARTSSTTLGPTVRLPAAAFTVTPDPTHARRASGFTVTAGHLVRGETYSIRLSGRTVTTGVTPSGTVVRRLTVPRTAQPGSHALTVLGEQTNRHGGCILRVVRR